MNIERCLGCGVVLGHLDRDPNGDENAACARCRAEECHDFDAEPNVTFDRAGHMMEPPTPASEDDFAAGMAFILRNKDAVLARTAGVTERYVVEQTFAALSQRPVDDGSVDYARATAYRWLDERDRRVAEKFADKKPGNG